MLCKFLIQIYFITEYNYCRSKFLFLGLVSFVVTPLSARTVYKPTRSWTSLNFVVEKDGDAVMCDLSFLTDLVNIIAAKVVLTSN